MPSIVSTSRRISLRWCLAIIAGLFAAGYIVGVSSSTRSPADTNTTPVPVSPPSCTIPITGVVHLDLLPEAGTVPWWAERS